MICEILSVGTELLLGQIANTDAQFLARRLSMLGITMYRQTTVGDNPARVKEALNTALSRSDLVITTGGLGPTEDDLTKEMVAEYFGLEMELHQPSLDKIMSYFTGTGRKMTPNNAKQAYFPKGAHIMPNRKGTAPGCVVEKDGKRVAVLPGPPFELVDMYEQQLEPYLRSLSDKEIRSRFLRIVGIGESEVETRLLDLFHWDTPTLALYCNPGEVEARITVMCERGIDPAPMLDPMEKEIRNRLGEAVYAEGLETSMPNEIVKLFRAKGITLSIAESLTGGMLSSQIVDISGASNVLVEAHTTYVNAAKVRVLGVKQETLDTYTEYSHECAREMAEGVLRMSGSDWAVSTTGVAGPGDDKVKAGTVFIAVAGKGRETKTQELHLRGDRTRVRQLTCLKVLDMLRREVTKAEI